MKPAVVAAAVVLALLGIACAGTSPKPVPVVGAAKDISALAGRWEGEYSSPLSQRSGTISFELSAASDSAIGQVMMIPRSPAPSLSQAPGPSGPPQALTIRFVGAVGDSIHGALDPYTDPSCGCTAQTLFSGRMRGDAIDGGYETRNSRSREVVTGQWSVRRKR